MARRATRAIGSAEAAAILGVGEAEIERLCRDEVIPHIGVAGRRVIPLAAFEQLIERDERARARLAGHLAAGRDAPARAVGGDLCALGLGALAWFYGLATDPALAGHHAALVHHARLLIPF